MGNCPCLEGCADNSPKEGEEEDPIADGSGLTALAGADHGQDIGWAYPARSLRGAHHDADEPSMLEEQVPAQVSKATLAA